MDSEITTGPDSEIEDPVRTAPARADSGFHPGIPVSAWPDGRTLRDDRAQQDMRGNAIFGTSRASANLAGITSHNDWKSSRSEPERDQDRGVPILSIERIAELRANIRPEHLLEMMEECVADLFDRLPTLRQALAARAADTVSAQAHAMVGMAGGYGMARLETRLRAVLAAARVHRLDQVDGAAGMIETDLTRTVAALRYTLRPLQTDLTT
jgi:HPt (histidine-containing phosphotransfer) domain-containing protein